MKKFVCSRITVPYDGSNLSEKALDTAIAFAKQDDEIEINLLTVVHIPTHLGIDRQAFVDKSKEMIKEAGKKLEALSNKTNTTVLEGNPGETIVEFAEKNNSDLIIMGSRGLSGLKELFLGSVSHYVTQKSDCHVLVIK